MIHSFDPNIAKNFGVNVAIFLNNIHFWSLQNIANHKHFHDGRYWTYNTESEFLQLFPYFSRQNLRTIRASCIKNDLLVEGNYNKSGYDHTIWYALTERGMALFNLQAEKEIINNNNNAHADFAKDFHE